MATKPDRILYVTPTVGFGSTASPKTTPAFDVQAGDLLVFIGSGEDTPATIGTPSASGGSVTWTSRQSIVVSQYCTMYLWTGAVGATATGITVTASGVSSRMWSFGVTVWRNHGGVGVTGKANVASGGPSLALATSANSAVQCGSDDWTASDGATRTWRTVNGSAMAESLYYRNTITYTVYSGYAPDTGTAGTTTVGLSAPTGQKYSIVGVEILGTAGSTPNTGSATGTLAWAGAAVGRKVTAGLAAGTLALAGAAAGTTQHQGAAAGTTAWAGTATGQTGHQGSAAGGVTWAGSATGSAPAVASKQGSAAGTVAWSGAATGVAPTVGVKQGSASGSLSWAGAATGVTSPKGSAAGGVTWAGTAAGQAPVPGVRQGAASGGVLWAGAAAGATARRGTVNAAITWVGVAAGSRSATGTSAGAVQWAGTATGTAPNPDKRDLDLAAIVHPDRYTATLHGDRYTAATHPDRYRSST